MGVLVEISSFRFCDPDARRMIGNGWGGPPPSLGKIPVPQITVAIKIRSRKGDVKRRLAVIFLCAALELS
ncbi:hypothetical protein DCC62_29890 [candidate division KSB1 bacterium]|nr:MAG: hypothetical protein DCC62_29890 [candidate division KSB1 bacterium]